MTLLPYSPACRGWWFASLCVASLYLVIAELTLRVFAPGDGIPLIWLPAGIAFAAMLACGWRTLAGVLLGAFINPMLHGASVMTCLTESLALTVAVTAGALLARRVLFPQRIDFRVSSILGIMVIALLISAFIDAPLNLCTVGFFGTVDTAQLMQFWQFHTLRDTVGIMVAAPAVLAWLQFPCPHWSPAKAVEVTAIIILLILFGVALHDWTATISLKLLLLAYGYYPLLMWTALRFSIRGAATLLMTCVLLTLWTLDNILGSASDPTLMDNAFEMQIFLALATLGTLPLSAAMTERNHSQAQLQQAHDALEQRVANRTAELVEANQQLSREIVERTRVEENLYRVQHEREVALAGLRDVIIQYLDTQLRVVWTNYGDPAARRDGVHCYEMLWQRQEPCPDCQVQLAFSTEQNQEKEATHQDKYFLSRCVLVRDDHDQITGAIVIGVDITRQKRTEAALQASMTELSTLFQALSELVLVVDAEGTILQVPQTGYQFSLITPNALLGKKVSHIFPELSAEWAHEVAQSVRNTGKAASYELPISMHGVTRWFSTNIAPLPDDRFLVVARDITQRKEAEEALRVSEERYAMVMHGAGVGIWDIDMRTNDVYLSPRWDAIVGYARGESPRTVSAWKALVHPDDVDRVQTELLAVNSGKTTSLDIEYRIRHRDGAYRWVQSQGIAVYDDDGQPYRMAGSLIDITERKAAEAQIAQYQQQLRRLAAELVMAEEQERRRIAQGLHDDIGQVLALAQLQLGALQRHVESPDAAEVLASVHQLVKDVLQTTRMLTFDLSPPVLYELGLEAGLEWLLHHLRGRHGLLTGLRVVGALPPLSEEMNVLTFQAVRELVMNVVRHAHARSAQVVLRPERNGIHITVDDDGEGFDVARLQAHTADSRHFGLFSIRERLRHIGGYLLIDSRPGAGARITLYIPGINGESEVEQPDLYDCSASPIVAGPGGSIQDIRYNS
jgi:two-component system sensor histidine kinase UhpB